MSFAYYVYLFVIWIQSPEARHSSWVNRCEDD